MYIITIVDEMDDTTTRVVMGCQDWADRFFAFVYAQPELNVQMEWAEGDEELPVRDEEEKAQAQNWIEHFASYSNIGACVND